MKNNPKISICVLALTTAVWCSTLASPKKEVSNESSQMWYAQGQQATNKAMVDAQKAISNSSRSAKNIILFVGDGMGVLTTTAARVYDGQRKGKTGEENKLFFETFPYLALSKTYNTNQQTPDSAGTMP